MAVSRIDDQNVNSLFDQSLRPIQVADSDCRTDAGRLLHLRFTLRQAGRRIRMISARDMRRKERVIYGQKS